MANQYPNLTEIVNEIAYDNGIPQLPEADWVWPVNAADIEYQASKLTKAEREIFAAGEHREQQQILEDKACYALWDFCEEVFDGPQHENFYKDF